MWVTNGFFRNIQIVMIHDSLNLAAISCQILLEDIYDKVDFEVKE